MWSPAGIMESDNLYWNHHGPLGLGRRLPVGESHACVICFIWYQVFIDTEQLCAWLLLDKIKILVIFLSNLFSSLFFLCAVSHALGTIPSTPLLPAAPPRPWLSAFLSFLGFLVLGSCFSRLALSPSWLFYFSPLFWLISTLSIRKDLLH